MSISIHQRLSMLFMIVVLAASSSVIPAADTHYVDHDNASPESPFTNGWASAANTIQEAIDQAANGDVVLVTNGVYDTGGQTNAYAGNLLTNRVVLNKSIILQAASANPADTVIAGASDNGANGPAAIRCIAIPATAGPTLIGFTISNGHTFASSGIAKDREGGGIYSDGSLTYKCYNCVIRNNSCGTGGGGGAYGYNATYSNCTFTGNTSEKDGGGALYGTFHNCTITGNAVLSNGKGGGLNGATAYNCLIAENTATNLGFGGAVQGGTCVNCVISNNVASYGGAAQDGGTLRNCLIINNRATADCGAIRFFALCHNCTITGNSAPSGSAIKDTFTGTNCIIYGNAPSDLTAAAKTFNIGYSCVPTNNLTTTVIVGGNNTTNNPLFVDTNAANYRLQAASSCKDNGTYLSWMDTAKDLDGNPRIAGAAVDMGAYECAVRAMPSGCVIIIR